MSQSDRFGFEAAPDSLSKAHASVVRHAILYCALLLCVLPFVILAIYKIFSGETGFIVMLSFFGMLALIFLYFARLYVKDLRAELIVLEGEVLKKWDRTNWFTMFFVFPLVIVLLILRLIFGQEGGLGKLGDAFHSITHSFYLVMDKKKIVSVKYQDYAALIETDLVRVTCYPHSLTVEFLERFDETDKRFIPAASGADT